MKTAESIQLNRMKSKWHKWRKVLKAKEEGLERHWKGCPPCMDGADCSTSHVLIVSQRRLRIRLLRALMFIKKQLRESSRIKI